MMSQPMQKSEGIKMKSRLTGLLACALLVVCGAVAGADSFHDKPVREVVVEVWPGWLDEETIQLRVTMSLARHDWVGPYGGALLNAVQFAQRASAMLYADTVRGVYAGQPPKRSQLAFADGLDFFIKGGMVIDAIFEGPYRCVIVYRQPARGIVILPGKGAAIAKDAHRSAAKPRFPVDGAIDYRNPPKNLATEWWEDDNTLRIRAWGAPRYSSSSRADRRYHAANAAELAAQARVLAIVRGITVRGGRFADPDSRSGIIIEKRFDENDTCEILYEVKRKGLRKRVEADLVGRPADAKPGRM